MNQQTDDSEDSMKQHAEDLQIYIKHGWNERLSKRKKWAFFAVVAAALALLVVPVLAWLYMQRSMETITKVDMPYSLFIGAGDAKPIQQLELSDIDVSGGAGAKDVVFCVYGTKQEKKYYLQMAHTTNIGFKYTIYKASMDSTGYISYLGKHYTKGEVLDGKYLNEGENGHATDKYHATTYSSGLTTYKNVQNAAEPLYWITNNKETLPNDPDDTEYYVNYYILQISWDENVQNNKETDMIYLMVG